MFGEQLFDRALSSCVINHACMMIIFSIGLPCDQNGCCKCHCMLVNVC